MSNQNKYKKLIFRGLGAAIIAAALAINITFNTGKTEINARLGSVQSQAEAACESAEDAFLNNGYCDGVDCYRVVGYMGGYLECHVGLSMIWP